MSKRPNLRKRPLSEAEIEAIILGDTDSYEDDTDEDPECDVGEERIDSEEDESEPDTIDVNLYENCENSEWRKVKDVASGTVITLDSIPEYTGNRTLRDMEGLSPVEAFYKFFPQSVFELVVRETNKYAEQCLDVTYDFPTRSRFHQWEEVSVEDIKKFVAIEIGMGLVHKPDIASYFQDSFWFTRTPGYGELFSRDRYLLIRSFLHFNDNRFSVPKGQDGYDPLYKVRPILDLTKDTYMQIFEPAKELSIDESMVKFKGRLNFKQYLPSKPSTKWGLKIWSLAESNTGFMLRFNVYTGKDNPQQGQATHGLASRVVHQLLRGFENKGHVVYTDNFYSSPNLFTDLRKLKIGACGTVRANRVGLPPEMKTLQKKKGELPTVWFNSNTIMLASSWQDTGKVNMISTVGDSGMSEILTKARKKAQGVKKIKPNIQVLYNTFMGGVDKFDQFCSTYNYNRKSPKWYQTLWHFVLEVALVNGCIAFNLQNPEAKLSHKKYRQKVIDGLTENCSRRSLRGKRQSRSAGSTTDRLIGRHFPEQFEDKKHKPNCIVCSVMPSQCKKKGKGLCKRRQTTWFCPDCPHHPPLCISDCFKVYHTQKNYRKICKCV